MLYLLLWGLVLPIDLPPATDSLSVRNAHALVFDSRRGDVLLIGGADDRRVLGDLWKWTGYGWECLSSKGLPPRTFPAACYDEKRDRVVVLGGNRVLFGSEADSNTFLSDHWEWDGRTWIRYEGPTPPARAEAAMTYDRKRHRTILFGGYRRVEGRLERLGDLWEYDGKTWKEITADGPPARNGAAMAFDEQRSTAVIFGGSNRLADTWEWDGKSWSPIAEDNTEARFNSTMAYDPVQNVMIRFGGWNGCERVNDTWTLQSGKWTRRHITGPPARNHAAMVFDSKRNVTVLVGGHDGEFVFGDVWEWNGQEWTQARRIAPLRRIDNGH